MRIRMALSAACVSVAALSAPGTARAQLESREGIALNNQILELRREIQALANQRGAPPPYGGNLGSYRGAPPTDGGGGEIAAQLLDRVQALEQQVRQLQGRIDEVDNARRRQGEDLSKQIGDLAFRLQGAGPGAAEPGGRPTVLSPPPGSLGAVPPGETAAPTPPPRRTPENTLQEGNAALARRDYAAAETAAREVLAGPRTPRSTDAQFLLAQALAGKRDYPQAAVAFDDAYNRGPKGSHAQDSLLGLASSLAAINERAASCQTLDKLRAEFPTVRADLRDQVTATRARAGCR